jgi:cyclopropane-fatty-acyl-phospholipid synthase
MRETIVPAEYSVARRPAVNWTQRTLRRATLERLSRLQSGVLTLEEGGHHHRFGSTAAEPGLEAVIRVVDPRFWTDVALGGNTGAGEAYLRGYWACDDLTAAVRILVRNREVLTSLEDGAGWITQPVYRILHWLHRNSRDGSRRNIAAHYDLGNEFFQLFLDPTLNYSCGIFPEEGADMEQASVNKMDVICRKLDLGPGDHLLEIGTGWGGFAIHAAGRYGCRVTTTTISRRQHELAAERVAAAGLGDKITLLRSDYRDLRGRFDKLVSVEMIEAVGHQYLDAYFAKCSDLLKPEGMMLLQAITIRDQLYAEAVKSVDFIKRYIFPGAFIPSVAAICDSVARATDMRLFHLQDIGPHYATTLRKWREQFVGNTSRIQAMGYPESFMRMWEFYLCYCEGGFLERNIGDVHMLLTKPLNRRTALGYE